MDSCIYRTSAKTCRCRKLNFDEIKQQTEEYFKEKFETANDSLVNSKFNYDIEKYKMASFMLHKACENYYYAIRLVYTQKNSKQHNLSKLSASLRRYSPELSTVFPRNNAE